MSFAHHFWVIIILSIFALLCFLPLCIRLIRRHRQIVTIRTLNETPFYVSPKIEVRKSKIGKGVFAISAISKGEIVVNSAKGPAKYLSIKEARYYASKPEWSNYVFQVDDNLLYVPMNGPETRDFINHSCDPNCGMKDRMKFVAIKDIAAGEEITYDYCMSEAMGCWQMQCECATKNCRKMITGHDWEIKELQQKYNGYFSEYLQKKINRNPVHKLLLNIYWRIRDLVRMFLPKERDV